MENEIKIYVADLSAYNNKILHGVWIDALLDIEEIQKIVGEMLNQICEEYSEEYAIHDYMGFDGYKISENENIETVHHIACFINEHLKVGAKLLENFGGDLEDAKKAIEENYCGCFESVADYTEDFISDTYEIPKYLDGYIDYEKMGRDLELNGDIFSIETAYHEVHIFYNH